MHSIHLVKQAEGESVTDFEAIPDKCQRKIYPIMPAHMELQMLRSDKMASIHERFGTEGKLQKHGANDFSNEDSLNKSPSYDQSGGSRSFSDVSPSAINLKKAAFGRT